MQIGVIGLGKMGGGVCESLLRSGQQVTAYDICQEAAQAFEGRANVVQDPLRVLAACEAVILSLPSSVQVEELCERFLTAGVKGKTIVDTSTSYPLSTRDLQARFKQAGGIFLDAPLMGSPAMAADGTITLTVGGDRADFEACKPLFDCFSKQAEYVGGPGSGHLVKLALNFTGLMYALTYSHIFPLMEKLGLDTKQLFDIITTQKTDCGVFRFYGQKVAEKDYRLDFALKLGTKDLTYVKRLYEDLGCPAFILDGALDLLRTGIRDGRGDNDFSEAAATMRDYLGL